MTLKKNSTLFNIGHTTLLYYVGKLIYYKNFVKKNNKSLKMFTYLWVFQNINSYQIYTPFLCYLIDTWSNKYSLQ